MLEVVPSFGSCCCDIADGRSMSGVPCGTVVCIPCIQCIVHLQLWNRIDVTYLSELACMVCDMGVWLRNPLCGAL